MRRNSLDLQILKPALWVVFLLIYQAATSVATYLPPLMGIFFTYMIILNIEKHKKVKKYDKRWYFCIFYLIFAEQVHGFALFSTMIAFLLFYYFVCDWLIVTFKSREILLVVFVASGYFAIYLVSSLLSHIANLPILNFEYEYSIYIISEAVLATILFRERFA
ncbi:MAG: hypothetical protein Q4D84_04265 [Campylobacter sp.]|nr:hypothetical protein [Campylobacter sp.]